MTLKSKRGYLCKERRPVERRTTEVNGEEGSRMHYIDA